MERVPKYKSHRAIDEISSELDQFFSLKSYNNYVI